MRKIIVSTLAAATLVGIGVQGAEAAAPRRAAATNAVANCLEADPLHVTADVWNRLLALGWKGDPTDHATRLYSPGCHRLPSGAVIVVPGHVTE